MPEIDESKYRVDAGWNDVPHLGEAEKRKQLNACPAHLRAARSKGIPSMGAGAIYPYDVESLLVDPFVIPPYWKRGFGLDDGWNRTAVIWGALDPEADILYLTTEHYAKEMTPQLNAQSILARGKWIPGVGDAAARTRDGVQIIDIYRSFGIDLELADKEVEAGLYDVTMRIASGRLKVFRTCQNWCAEYQRYHRDEKGKIVKVDDHLMDGTRYLCRPRGLQRMIAKPVDTILPSLDRSGGDSRAGY
jgi:hypothetical protein